MNADDIDILKKVTLLGIMNKKPDETLKDIQVMLVATGMYNMKEAKQIFKQLKAEKYLMDGQLTLKGLTGAKEAEALFKQ
ncbi:hypothetical protein ACM66Z_04065 [Sulfurovum sp. ST-21]|uniref:Uncharacterized protein n=1 Tax=Sulfurovum indicum TaxID=2779528 RepID=A0A7M1S6Q0_9BACT|nr:hypothetical protein [Sulfurovum indicum]QOR62651.1 hypothetical protein IMZ28_04050 [Sulfurovum indicum]